MDYKTDWKQDGSIQISSANGTVDVMLRIGSNTYLVNGEAGSLKQYKYRKMTVTICQRMFFRTKGNYVYYTDSVNASA